MLVMGLSVHVARNARSSNDQQERPSSESSSVKSTETANFCSGHGWDWGGLGQTANGLRDVIHASLASHNRQHRRVGHEPRPSAGRPAGRSLSWGVKLR